MTSFHLISWNTAKRLKQIEGQIEFLHDQGADLVALQEVLPSTEAVFRSAFKHTHPFQVSSFELALDSTLLTKKRMFGELLVSKFPIEPQSPDLVRIPWTERLLSAKVTIGIHDFILHTTHIPPGSSNGWIKVEMLNGIFDHLVENKNRISQILCGDFNTPKLEDKTLGLVTFAQHIDKSGEVKTKKVFRGGDAKKWDKAERKFFKDLPQHGLSETFRKIHPDDFVAYSWSFIRKGREFRNRFDHIFASKKFITKSCEYLNIPRILSDHKPISAVFELD